MTLMLYGLAAEVSTDKMPDAGTHLVVPLWPSGTPGSEVRKDEPEKVVSGSVLNIHFPTLTVFLPAKDKAADCAVIVCPGGGHRTLVMQKEGCDVAQRLSDHGLVGFVLKNRLARDDATPEGAPQPYTVERDALADAQRAIRLVRSRASGWGSIPPRLA